MGSNIVNTSNNSDSQKDVFIPTEPFKKHSQTGASGGDSTRSGSNSIVSEKQKKGLSMVMFMIK